MEHLSNFIYLSKLAPNAKVTCIADIIQVSRKFNQEHQITGILIFDGMRFCQYLEGPHEALQTLIAAIAKDPRHVEFTPKLALSNQESRLFPEWSMAYLFSDDAEPLEEFLSIESSSVLSKLLLLLPVLDTA